MIDESATNLKLTERLKNEIMDLRERIEKLENVSPQHPSNQVELIYSRIFTIDKLLEHLHIPSEDKYYSSYLELINLYKKNYEKNKAVYKISIYVTINHLRVKYDEKEELCISEYEDGVFDDHDYYWGDFFDDFLSTRDYLERIIRGIHLLSHNTELSGFERIEKKIERVDEEFKVYYPKIMEIYFRNNDSIRKSFFYFDFWWRQN